MIQFTEKTEQTIRERINAIFTLLGTTIFCISELVNIGDNMTSLIIKIIFVILFFWFILGKILSKILYLLLKEIVEDIEGDCKQLVKLSLCFYCNEEEIEKYGEGVKRRIARLTKNWREEERPLSVEDLFKDDPPLNLPIIKGLEDYIPQKEFFDESLIKRAEAPEKEAKLSKKENKATRNIPKKLLDAKTKARKNRIKEKKE